ncbi:MAG: AraC family transcriptional regulator [Lachnospiraceae bacterium]|nr:AraC family transcriptional regulator [Lachnospiraceae bacterium]
MIQEKKGDRFGCQTQAIINISDLCLTINRLAYEQYNNIIISQQNSLYQNICTYIENNIDSDLSLDTISEHFYLSKYYLSHVFKDNIGISIHQYISKKRLKLCHESILAGNPISQVYNQYGFEDYSSFYRAFKKEYGMSPKTLIQQSRNNVTKATKSLKDN